MTEQNDARRLTALLYCMAVLGLVILGHDIWDVVAGDTDLNQYIPFFLPAVLLVFILITLRIKRALDAEPTGGESGDDRQD